MIETEENEKVTKMEIFIKLLFFIAIIGVLFATELSENMGIALSFLGAGYLVWLKSDIARLRGENNREKPEV